MTAAPAHDFATVYAERDLGEVPADFSRRTGPDGRAVVVEGHCPCCRGRTATEFRRGVPGTGTKGVLSRLLHRTPAADDADPLATEVLFCECGYPHPRQPADAVFVGCGASWRVRGTASGGGP